MTTGHPRITSGVDFVQRWEARALFAGLLSGERAHRILLELVRRVANDRPPDLAEAFARLYEMQQFLNAMTSTPHGAPSIPIESMIEALDAMKAALLCNRDESPALVQQAPPEAPTRILTQARSRR